MASPRAAAAAEFTPLTIIEQRWRPCLSHKMLNSVYFSPDVERCPTFGDMERLGSCGIRRCLPFALLRSFFTKSDSGCLTATNEGQ